MPLDGVKRPRVAPSAQGLDLLGLIRALPKDVATSSGDPLGLLVLRFVGQQDVAATCRAALDWLSAEGRRFVVCLNDETRGPKGPFAPLRRLVASHVEAVRLGRYGRQTVDERAELILACSNARSLRCVYAKLTGLSARLAASGATLSLRALRHHQCRLEAADAAELLARAEQLESVDFCGEALGGLGDELCLRRPLLGRRCLRSAEFTDCGLCANDVKVLFDVYGEGLRKVHIQASDLRGLRACCRLQNLERLSLLDCNLAHADAVAVMAQCPRLEVLELCGNPLNVDGDSSGEEGAGLAEGVRWPAMPTLLRADFRTCNLDAADEEELRSCLRGAPGMDLRVLADGQGSAGPGGAHIIFDSGDESE